MEKIITMHQPNYLPWIGLFSKIARADYFVISDIFPFTRHSLTNRGKVRTNNGWVYLTIPINRNQYNRRIYDVVMPEDERWKTDHWKTIYHNYVRAPFFSNYKDFFEQLYQSHFEYMWQINEQIISYLLNCFGISVKVLRATELSIDQENNPTDVIIELVKRTGGDTYLSGPSGSKYLDLEKFPMNNVELKYTNFKHPAYTQRYPGFEPNMSAIDLLFNMGPQSSEIIKNSGNIESTSMAMRADNNLDTLYYRQMEEGITVMNLFKMSKDQTTKNKSDSIDVLQLTGMVNGRIVGTYDPNLKISGTSSIEGYITNRVTFAKNFKYGKKISAVKNAIIVVPEELEELCRASPQNIYIVVKDVERSIIELQEFFYGESFSIPETQISPAAWISKSAEIGTGVYIGENVHIGDNSVIGDGANIMAGVFIGNSVKIGKRTTIKPMVTCENCVIGDDTIIRTGTRIGDEGFRYLQDIEHKKVLRTIHSGSVVIGNRVVIGANTSIQRATFEGKPTLISDDVKIASMIVISHNVTIGARTIIISESMIGGSTIVGEDAWIGMGAVVSQGLKIGNRAKILINAVVVKDVPDDGLVSGFYAMPHRQWKNVSRKLMEFGAEP